MICVNVGCWIKKDSSIGGWYDELLFLIPSVPWKVSCSLMSHGLCQGQAHFHDKIMLVFLGLPYKIVNEMPGPLWHNTFQL